MDKQQSNSTQAVTPVKIPITYEDQVKKIISKGFLVDNTEECISFLKQASYYRLSAYLLPFKKSDGTYFENIKFTCIKRIYEFDSHIRSLVFQVIEQIEFYMRTQLSYHLAFSYGAIGYLDDATRCQRLSIIKQAENCSRKS